MLTFKVGGHSVPKIEWKQTDGQRDGSDCLTCCINAVGKTRDINPVDNQLTQVRLKTEVVTIIIVDEAKTSQAFMTIHPN